MKTLTTLFFLRNTVQHRRSHTRAYIQPYEHTHVMNRGRLPALVGGGGSSVVGKRETRLYEPEERLHSFRRGVKTGAFCSASRNASE